MTLLPALNRPLYNVPANLQFRSRPHVTTADELDTFEYVCTTSGALYRMVGLCEGCDVGKRLGALLGCLDGTDEGCRDGCPVGRELGCDDGTDDG